MAFAPVVRDCSMVFSNGVRDCSKCVQVAFTTVRDRSNGVQMVCATVRDRSNGVQMAFATVHSKHVHVNIRSRPFLYVKYRSSVKFIRATLKYVHISEICANFHVLTLSGNYIATREHDKVKTKHERLISF